MSDHVQENGDSPELEALFDTLSHKQAAQAAGKRQAKRMQALTSLPIPRYSRLSKLIMRDMAMPRPWVSKARSGLISR